MVFKISLPNLIRTRSAVFKLFPAGKRKRQNEKPGRFDSVLLQFLMEINKKNAHYFDTAQLYTLTSLEKLM